MAELIAHNGDTSNERRTQTNPGRIVGETVTRAICQPIITQRLAGRFSGRCEARKYSVTVRIGTQKLSA